MQRGCLPVLDVHRDLDDTRARQVETERANAREAAPTLAHDARDLARDGELASEIDVERDQWPARADEHGAGGLVQPRWPVVGRQLARVDARLEPCGAAAPEVGRPPLGRRVHEHGHAAVRGEPPRDCIRSALGTSHVLGHERHDRHDIRRTDARVRALVRPQVDALPRNGDRSGESVGQLPLLADEREDRAVVILVRVHVEQAGMRGEGSADRVDRHEVAPLAEVRNRLEWPHAAYSRSVDARSEYELGGEHDSAGRPDEAVPHYERALALGLPDELLPGCLLQLGSTLRNLGRVDEALVLFDDGLEQFPEHVSLRLFRAFALADLGREREALVDVLNLARTRIDAPEVQRYARSLENYTRELA